MIQYEDYVQLSPPGLEEPFSGSLAEGANYIVARGKFNASFIVSNERGHCDIVTKLCNGTLGLLQNKVC